MRASALAISATAIVLFAFSTNSALAQCAPSSPYCTSHYSGYSGAPGPIAGAGIPALAIIGGGAYFLFRRLRRNKH
jgi:hypothetical protein